MKITHFTQLLKGKLSKEELEQLKTAHDRLGDIVLIQIPKELEGKQQIIGQAILDFYPGVKSVFRKGPVSGEFRIRELDLIAGEQKTETIHRENGCQFKLDVSKLYFSGRLSTERKRVSDLVKDNEEIIDMFAGVGPFSILIAKEHPQTKIHCIDINPDAIAYLEENAQLNKVQEQISADVGDVNDFRKPLSFTADRIIMNLPSSRENFFPTALDFLKEKGGTIHFYLIAESEEEVKEFIEKNLEAKYKILFMRQVINYSATEASFVADIQVEKG